MSASEPPRPVGDALRSVRRELGLGEPGELDELAAAWPALVGAMLADHAHVRALREGSSRSSPTPRWASQLRFREWASQLRYLDQVLVERITAELPGVAVRQVRVAVARAGVLAEAPDHGADLRAHDPRNCLWRRRNVTPVW